MKLLVVSFVLLLSVFAFAELPTVSTLNKKQITEELQSLYPYLTAAQLQTKISEAKDPDHFIRSFVPYYYLTLRKYPELVGQLIAMGREAGWCIGDAHLTNFGPMLNDQGQSEFTVNDMDDAGPCPLISDFLKFLVSTKLDNPKDDLKSLAYAYKMGVLAVPKAPSAEVRDLLNKSKLASNVIDPTKLSAPGKLLRDANARELTAQEKNEILNAMSRAYGPQVLFLDGFATSKIGGGSAGLQRFEVLVNLPIVKGRKFANPQLIQFKRLVSPGIFPLAAGPIPNPAQRINITLNMQQGPGSSGLYSVQFVSGMTMLMEPQWLGNIKIEPKSLSDVQKHNINIDIAYSVGEIHLKSATDAYRQNISGMPEFFWESAAVNTAQYLTEVFKVLKQ